MHLLFLLIITAVIVASTISTAHTPMMTGAYDFTLATKSVEATSSNYSNNGAALVMLCYVMLCYVMLCYVMLCYVMLCYVMLCYVMLCYVMLCYVMLWYGMLCYVMLCYVMLCYVMLCYVMLCYVMLCYVMLCYVMLCYVMLCYCSAWRKTLRKLYGQARLTHCDLIALLSDSLPLLMALMQIFVRFMNTLMNHSSPIINCVTTVSIAYL